MLLWIDFTCPFCYIGMKRLFSVIEENNLNPKLEIQSFLLNPDLKGKQDYIKTLSEKYNVPYETGRDMVRGVENLALEDNIKLDFEDLRAVSSTNAHILAKYYENNEKYYDLIIKIFEKYFLEKKNISNINVLEEIVNELKINEIPIKEILEDGKFIDEINADMYQASTFKVNSTPTIVLRNGKKYVGSRSNKSYLEIIEEDKSLEE